MNFTWKSDLGPEKLPEFEHIKRIMITLSVITLSGFHCIFLLRKVQFVNEQNVYEKNLFFAQSKVGAA
jgi:hypothetical protein